MKLRTTFCPPPVPFRDHDWCAYDEDNYEPGEPIGWGESEKDAILDYYAQVDERAGV